MKYFLAGEFLPEPPIACENQEPRLLPEEVWVAVLAKLVEDKPVSNLTLAAKYRFSNLYLFVTKVCINQQLYFVELPHKSNPPENVLETFPNVVVVLASHRLVQQTEPDSVEP